MQWEEGAYVEHKNLPDVIWEVFEVTQIGTVTLELWHEPQDYEAPEHFTFLFEVLKSGELVEPHYLRAPNAMEVIAISAAKEG
jgi:hypothetical protein